MCFSVHIISPKELLQASAWLKHGTRPVTPPIHIPLHSWAIAASWTGRHDAPKAADQKKKKKIKKNLELLLLTGANRLGMNSFRLPLLSYFSMPNTCKEWRMGKSSLWPQFPTNSFSKEFKFGFTWSAVQYFDHEFTRAWRKFVYKINKQTKQKKTHKKRSLKGKKKKKPAWSDSGRLSFTNSLISPFFSYSNFKIWAKHHQSNSQQYFIRYSSRVLAGKRKGPTPFFSKKNSNHHSKAGGTWRRHCPHQGSLGTSSPLLRGWDIPAAPSMGAAILKWGHMPTCLNLKATGRYFRNISNIIGNFLSWF